jgi:hypothetical protein
LADSLEFAHSTIAIKRGGLSGNLRNLLVGERASEREPKVPSLLRGRERAGRRRKKRNNKGKIESKRARERERNSSSEGRRSHGTRSNGVLEKRRKDEQNRRQVSRRDNPSVWRFLEL